MDKAWKNNNTLREETEVKDRFGSRKSKSPAYQAIKDFIEEKGDDEFVLSEVEERGISLNSFRGLVDFEYIIYADYKPMTPEEICEELNDMWGDDMTGGYWNTYEGEKKKGIPIFTGWEVNEGKVCKCYEYYKVRVKGWK